MDKAELIITALQQRIGEMAAQYETQIAMLRAELTVIMQDKQNTEQAAKEYSDSLTQLTNNAIVK